MIYTIPFFYFPRTEEDFINYFSIYPDRPLVILSKKNLEITEKMLHEGKLELVKLPDMFNKYPRWIRAYRLARPLPDSELQVLNDELPLPF